MRDSSLEQTLEVLFKEAGYAHHQAFLDTDGEDPEWPIWYANYLQKKLAGVFQTDMTLSQLIYLLVFVDKEQTSQAPDHDWKN